MAITDQITLLTQSEIASRAMRIGARQLVTTSTREYENALRNFWKHSGMTPQEMSDSLGTDAGDFFAVYSALRTFILTVAPNASLTPISSYGTFTINGDGTVTIDSVV